MILWSLLGLFLGTGLTLALFIVESKVPDDLHPVGKVLLFPWRALFRPLDILFNWTVGTVLFLEFPREFLFSTRVQRHLKGAGYRRQFARWICLGLLRKIDPSHCR